MRKVRQIIITAVATSLCVGMTTACGSGSGSSDKNADGKVYYLNKKPEHAKYWEKLAKQFQKETGIETKITTSPNYDETLRSEIAKSDAPTMFQVDGPPNLEQWKKYGTDLSDTKGYKELTDSKLALKADDKPVALPFAIDAYGLIYNKSILNKYFKSSWASVKSVSKLNNFEALKTVADEVQKHKDDLGIKGAFTSAGMDDTSGYRFNYHLPSGPLFYEYKDNNWDMNTTVPAVKGTYAPNMKKIWDLYIHDSTVPVSAISGKSMSDATSEFALGEALFLQSGTWSYTDISGQSVEDSDIGVLPIYLDVKGEEEQGLNTVTSNYWVVNSKAPKANQKATKKFIDWLITSDAARTSISQDMGFLTPFKTFSDKKYAPKNPIYTEYTKLKKEGKYDVYGVCAVTPSHQWQKDLGNAMLNYAQGTGDWDAVQKVFSDDWAKEYNLVYKQ